MGGVRVSAYSLPAQGGRLTRAALIAALTGGVAFLSFALAWSPFLTLGAVIGALLTVFALMQPLALVGLMLLIGPADLSVMTGGFKSMFENLGGLDMNGIRLICMSFALTLVIISERDVFRQIFRPAAIFYVLLIAWCGFTLLYSPDPLEGARLVMKIAYPLLVFLVIVGLSPDTEQLDRLMDWVLIGAAVMCLVVNPLYHLFGDFERNIGGWMRLRGVGAHQNPFAFYLTAILLISFVRFLTRKQARYLALCGIASIWMLLTVTRIAFLAAVVAIVVVGLVSALAARRTKGLIASLVVGGIIAAVVMPPVLERSLGFMPTPGQLVSMIRSPQTLYNAMNWEGREIFWAVVFKAYTASPVIGLGMGASSVVLRLHFPGMGNVVVHNDYLRLLTDAGIVGTALFALALAAWLVVALRAARVNSRCALEYALPAVGVLAGLSIIGITDNAFDYYGPYTQYAGFLCAGAAAAAIRSRTSDEGTGVNPPLERATVSA